MDIDEVISGLHQFNAVFPDMMAAIQMESDALDERLKKLEVELGVVQQSIDNLISRPEVYR
jgi:hypothetical protein